MWIDNEMMNKSSQSHLISTLSHGHDSTFWTPKKLHIVCEIIKVAVLYGFFFLVKC